MKFSVGVVYRKLSRIKFYENQLGESHTLLKGMNEILSVFSALFELAKIRYRICPQKFIE